MRSFLTLVIVAMAVMVMSSGCSCSSTENNDTKAATILRGSTEDIYSAPLYNEEDSMVAQPVETHFSGSRSKTFNDSNHVQLVAAETLGIKPITDMASAWNTSRPLELIASCEEYYLDKLKLYQFLFL